MTDDAFMRPGPTDYFSANAYMASQSLAVVAARIAVDLDLVVNRVRVNETREIGRGVAGPGGARQALTLFTGGPARIVGTYSRSWMRPSKVRLLIMSRATSG